MGNVGNFLRTRWGAVVIWVLVMYLTAFLWNVVDSRGWYAFPTYVLAGLLWIGSFVNMLTGFVEWTGTGVRLKSVEVATTETETVSTVIESDELDDLHEV